MLCAAALLALAAARGAHAASFGCEILQGSCLANETLLVRLNSSEAGQAPNNSHAQLANFSGGAYPYSVCCWTDAFRSMGNACTPGSARVLALAAPSDSHSQAGNQSGYAWSACLNASVGTVSCEYPVGACSAGYAPVASMASSEPGDGNLTNAHLAAPGHYARQACCRIASLGPPSVAAAIISPINVTRRSDVLCGNGTVSDPDGDAVTLHYDWYANGTSVAVLNLPMDYDPDAATTHDISGYGNHAAVHGAAFLPTGGRIGGAFSFDGIDDYLDAGNSSRLDITGPITIAAWVRLAQGSHFDPIASKAVGNGAANDPFDFRTDGSAAPKLELVRANASSFESVSSASALGLNAWHHVAVTVDAGKAYAFYIDGQPAGNGTFTVSPTGNANPVLIGRRDDGLSLNGSIDEEMVLNRSLSPGEVATLYATGNRFLNRSELRKTDEWNCSITPVDSTGLNGTTVRSARTRVEGSLPLAATLLYPANGNASVFERTVAFDWNDSDEPDGDPLNYTLNLSVAAGPCGVQREQTGIAQSNFTLGELCVDQAYWWNVTACDVDGCSPASATSNFTVASVLSIALRNASADLGALSFGQSAATDAGAGSPFLLENDGNVVANVTLAGNASPFSTVGLGSTAFQFRVAQNETGSLDAAGSQVSYAPVPANATSAIGRFNYSDASDLVAIHVNVTVPPGEPSGPKAANITLQAVVAG